MKIEITWLSDECHCDTCGTNWAEGAAVSFDGEEVLRLEPCASCFGGDDYSEGQVYQAIFEKLGHGVVTRSE